MCTHVHVHMWIKYMSILNPKPGLRGELDVSDDPDDWLCWWDTLMLTESSSLSMSSKPSPSSRTYVCT